MQKTILRGHVKMILYNLPSVLLAIIGILVIGLEFGWDALLRLPFNLLLAWLLFTMVFVFAFRWYEIREEENEYKVGLEEFKKELVEAIKESVKQAIIEAIAESKK